MAKSITVLLSTYNGEKYLSEQIESVLNQKDVNVQLLVRDDGSKDQTVAILKEYARKYDNVRFYTGNNLGPANSFFDLINRSEGTEYYAFCDQDDVWDNDKLIRAITEIEKRNGNENTPCLYYSNLKIVDENLNFYRNAHTSPLICPEKYCSLVDNFMTGCTGVYNESLAKIMRNKLPDSFSMHDTWVFIVASFFGMVVYDFEPHISYRQHSHNVIGTTKKRFSLKTIFLRVNRLFNRELQPRYNNAQTFLKIYSDQLSNKDKHKVSEISEYKNSFSNWMKLLFDKDIHTTSLEKEIRYRALIILRII